jgi:hypothetical protein
VHEAVKDSVRFGQIAGIDIGLGFIELARGNAGPDGVWLAFLGWFLRTRARAEADNATTQPALERAC